MEYTGSNHIGQGHSATQNQKAEVTYSAHSVALTICLLSLVNLAPQL